MTCQEIPEYRRGSAFSLDVNLENDDKSAVTTDAADLVAQLYDKPDGEMLAVLTVEDTETVGKYTLSATLDPAEVDTWPETVYTNVFNKVTEIDSTVITVKITGQLSRNIPADPEPEL